MLSALINRFKQHNRAAACAIQSLDPLQLLGYQSTIRLLEQAGVHQWLPKGAIYQLCDFGSGTGGPTLALQRYFEIPETRLTLLESHPPQAQRLRSRFPQSSLHAGDGLEWLAKTAQRFDLITAFMLGPDYDDAGLARRFINAASDRLTSQGCLLITSDTATMHTVHSIIEGHFEPESKWQANWLIPDPEHAQTPPAVMLSRNARPQAFYPAINLPKAILKRALVADRLGVEEWEEHALYTEFERAYLAATIESLSLQCPNHPGVPALRALLNESNNATTTTKEPSQNQTPPFSSILQALQSSK